MNIENKKEDLTDEHLDKIYIPVADMETKEYILNLLCECCQLRCPYQLTECNTCSACSSKNLCETCIWFCIKCCDEECVYCIRYRDKNVCVHKDES